MKSYIEIITCIGCDLCNKCIKLCRCWNIRVKIRDIHLEELDGETYPIIYLSNNRKISYETFCDMICKGEIGT